MSTTRIALDSLSRNFADAWNRRDVAALHEVFSEDADFVDPAGNIWHGRAAIAAEHRRLFRGAMSHSSLRLQIAKLRMLTRTTALIHGIWSMTGHTADDPAYLPVRTGLWFFVAMRGAPGWRIVCAQITDVPV